MHNSPAGKKLNPLIAEQTAKIYNRDPVRYKFLIRWVWVQQKAGWPDEAIAEALRLPADHLDWAANPWAYLTKLLAKGKGRASEQESQNYKTEVGKLADEFVEFMKQRQLR